MLRLLTIVFLPAVFSQCTTCNNQGYIGIYGNMGTPSPNQQFFNPSAQSNQAQYTCNSCQSSLTNPLSGRQYSAPQFNCNNCQYAPGTKAQNTMDMCICTGCQAIQGSTQFTCNSCQMPGTSSFGSSTPSINQQFRNPSTSGCSTCQNNNNYGSPAATQQFYNPSANVPCSTCGNNGYSNPQLNQQFFNPQQSACPTCQQQNYGYQYPAQNQQFFNPTQTTGCSTCGQNYQNQPLYNPSNGFNQNQQFRDPSSSPTFRYNELTNTNLGFPVGYPPNQPNNQRLFDQSNQFKNNNNFNQNGIDNDNTYTSGQYVPGTGELGRVYDSRVGGTQFASQGRK